MKKTLEIWADSFHEGSWCCENICKIASKLGYSVSKSLARGFQPRYAISSNEFDVELIVFGSYRSWSPLPPKIEELINWGKPDFLAFDAENQKILFAVEETAATPTGNQAMQRCERQYGSARFKIPYWYLISEFGVHRDGGVRRDSIWPTIAAIKLSILKSSPCLVLHYSNIDNPEDYSVGSGVQSLFYSLFTIIKNHQNNSNLLSGFEPLLETQYCEMIQFVKSQWSNIIDFLPSEALLSQQNTPRILSELATGNISNKSQISGLLEWPIIPNIPRDIQEKWSGKPLLKYDKLCDLMEKDVDNCKAYYLSDNAGSGRPPERTQLQNWIMQQEALFNRSSILNPPATFSLKLSDFPDTGNGNDRRHLTTAKNIVYLYDSWNEFVNTLCTAYPRLCGKIKKKEKDIPLFVYVSNSIKPGRLFGDPFTGQLAAFSTAFGKFDASPRMVLAYFPHQVHTQALDVGRNNKGLTLMAELTDYILFHAGVAVNLSKNEVL